MLLSWWSFVIMQQRPRFPVQKSSFGLAPSFLGGWLVSRVAKTKYHRLNGLNNRNHFWARSSTLRSWEIEFLLRPLSRHSLHVTIVVCSHGHFCVCPWPNSLCVGAFLVLFFFSQTIRIPVILD